jgi:D-alanyl-D-alanine carboxypeptidase
VKVKARQSLRFLLAGTMVLATVGCETKKPSPKPPASREQAAPPPKAPPTPPPDGPAQPPVVSAGCGALAADPVSQENGRTADMLAWRPFGRAESGWRTYAPRVAHEIGVDCPPESAGFAEALRAWQRSRGMPDDGRMGESVFLAMKARWQENRPFVRTSARGLCPAPPADDALETATPSEGYMGKVVQARAGALEAYRRMTAAAREEAPEIFSDPNALAIFSAFRSPESDAQRCARDGNCDGVRRATCSPHRTGLALDLYVGRAPGFGPDSSVDPNRLHQSQTPIYRWLVANAERFGFVNYPFEPWHWEWTGEAP